MCEWSKVFVWELSSYFFFDISITFDDGICGIGFGVLVPNVSGLDVKLDAARAMKLWQSMPMGRERECLPTGDNTGRLLQFSRSFMMTWFLVKEKSKSRLYLIELRVLFNLTVIQHELQWVPVSDLW